MNDSTRQYEEKMWEVFELSRRAMPEVDRAVYGGLGPAVYGQGALSAKTKRLMALAVAVQAGCSACMVSQCGKALDAGAGAEEILEACAVAVSMGGTLAWSHMLEVVQYLDERGLMEAWA